MNADDLAIKLTGKIDFMIKQYLPRPACQTKHKAHSELVAEVKKKIAERLGGNGLVITITA